MPRDAVSRTENVERNGGHKWVKTFYTNVQSFLSKKKEIEIYLSENNVDILFFTEAWITEEHGDSVISLIGFQSPIISRKSRGGTCIFVKESISFYEVNPPNQCEDSSWIVI